MNKSKAKGTRAETKVVNYMVSHGLKKAKRKALHGNKDMGDIEFSWKDYDGYTYECIAEVKTGEMTRNYSRRQLNDWLDQACIEASNANVEGAYLIIVRYRRAIEDAEVWWKDKDCGYGMMYLDDFVDGLSDE